MKAGSLLLDCSTIDPLVSKEMAEQASAKGAVYMDAPVSGGMKTVILKLFLLLSLQPVCVLLYNKI